VGPEATIERVAVEAGHDGEAELMVVLRTSSGVRLQLSLDAAAAARLVDAVAADSANDLIGVRFPWHSIEGGPRRPVPTAMDIPA
jgi:hypothetical protein